MSGKWNRIPACIAYTKREQFAKILDVDSLFLYGAICVKKLYLKDKMYLPQAASPVTSVYDTHEKIPKWHKWNNYV